MIGLGGGCGLVVIVVAPLVALLVDNVQSGILLLCQLEARTAGDLLTSPHRTLWTAPRLPACYSVTQRHRQMEGMW